MLFQSVLISDALDSVSRSLRNMSTKLAPSVKTLILNA